MELSAREEVAKAKRGSGRTTGTIQQKICWKSVEKAWLHTKKCEQHEKKRPPRDERRLGPGVQSVDTEGGKSAGQSTQKRESELERNAGFDEKSNPPAKHHPGSRKKDRDKSTLGQTPE
ncbi:hypothetical protein Tco_0581370 [Tanacetum coccineum]